MSQTIVIAEIAKGAIHPTTAELVTAANVLGSAPIVIVPCADTTIADAASEIQGISKVIALKSGLFAAYDASSWATAIDAITPSGIIITSANPQSKDLAARLAARRNIPVVQDVVAIEGGNLTSPIYSGKAMQTVSIDGDAVISVRANIFARSYNNAGGPSLHARTSNTETSGENFSESGKNKNSITL